MRSSGLAGATLILAGAASLLATSAAAQAKPAINVCGLLTKAQVEQASGQKVYTEPEGTNPNNCTWGGGEAQIILYSGPGSAQRIDGFIKAFKQDNLPKTPVQGVGDAAYVIYPLPKTKYQDHGAFLIVTVGQHTMALSVIAPEGKKGPDMLPAAITLAKIVIPKLR